MKIGSIITVDYFDFPDGNFDEHYQRKCIVLFSDYHEGERRHCVCPIVSQLSAFNAAPENYYLLPFSRKNGKKFFFAKLSSAVYLKDYEYRQVIDRVDTETMKRLIEKLKLNALSYGNDEYYESVVNKLEKKMNAVN